jgi:hypothetical protein
MQRPSPKSPSLHTRPTPSRTSSRSSLNFPKSSNRLKTFNSVSSWSCPGTASNRIFAHDITPHHITQPNKLDLRQLPLAATAATLCALSGTEQGTDYASLTSTSRIDAAGYESDGGEEARLNEAGDVPKSKGGAGEKETHGEEEGDAGKEAKVDVPGPSWGWRFNKSPLGESSS